MSVSSLENKQIGHKFGLAYLSDIDVAGGVSSLGYDNDGTPALLTGAITLSSGDSSVNISTGMVANQINLQASQVLINLNQINIASGSSSAVVNITANDNYHYFYITETTDELPPYSVNFSTTEILPVGFTIFVKNSIPYSALDNYDIVIKQNGVNVIDIAGTSSLIHTRGGDNTINTPFVCLTVRPADVATGLLTML